MYCPEWGQHFVPGDIPDKIADSRYATLNLKRPPFNLAVSVGQATRTLATELFNDPTRARVLVALSGGPDSTALLLALHQSVPDVLIGAAHFHHGLRGADANEDASFCAGVCGRIGVPLAIALGKVIPEGQSPQAAARADRYQFLQETAMQWGANCLAVAHTADDQAETVLQRVLRGTSVDGLPGIPSTRALAEDFYIIRPLLQNTRAQIETFCAENTIVPRQDPSNQGTKYVRSRLRQRLPEIAREFNPRLREALCRLADNARRDSDYIRQQSDALWTKAIVTLQSGEWVSLSIPILQEAHTALLRRVLLTAIRRVYPDHTPVEREEATTTAFVDALEAMVHTRTGAVTLPGNVQARLTQKRTLLTLSYPSFFPPRP